MKLKVLLFITITSVIFYFPNNSHAQGAEQPVRCMQYEDAQLAEPDTNVISTNIGTALAQLDTATFFVGGDDTCDLAAQSFECIENGTVSDCDLGPATASKNSLLGMTGAARAVATGDVIPVNFAYYFRDQVKNVPIVGEKVYAQSDSYTDIYGAEIALAVWKAFRNMALGLMSIFLIVIGIMIILRKKVDPRTVLTLQAALPKVIISMILIVFSFAIGALFIRFVPAARGMAGTVFTSVTDELSIESNFQPEVTFSVSAMGLIGIIGAFVMSGPGLAIGALTALLGPLTLIVWLVLLMMVYLRTIIIYVRMLVHTVTAPFQFAFGAIPGNDAMIINWFKKMLAWLLSIPAMFLLLELAQFVQLYAIDSTFFGKTISGYEGTFFPGVVQSSLQQLFLLLVSPFISMLLLVQALTAPKKIEGWIVGEQKKR